MRAGKRVAVRALLVALGASACSSGSPEPSAPKVLERSDDDPIEQASRHAMTNEWNLALSVLEKARDGSSLDERERLDALEANVLRVALGRKRQAQRGECGAAGVLGARTLGIGDLRELALDPLPLAECEVASGVDFIEDFSRRTDIELDRELYLELAHAFERRHPALGAFWLERMERRLHGPQNANARTPEQVEADRLERLRVCKLRSDAFEALSKLTRPEPLNFNVCDGYLRQ